MANYLLITELKNEDVLKSILDRYFDGYTAIPSHGRWKGTNEQSITILLCNVEPTAVQQTAEEIKSYNKQESVMILELPGTVSFI